MGDPALPARLGCDAPTAEPIALHGLVHVFVTIRDGRGRFRQADCALCAVTQAP